MDALPDYYEVLGVPRNAKLTDVTRAYNRWVADFRKESTPPDPKRESLLREAFEVLSDEQRRDAYDAELARARSPRGKRAPSPLVAVASVAVLALAAAAAWWALRPASAPKAKTRTAEQLVQAMSGSVSPLVAFDISGKSTPLGLAFVIEDKVMVANCQALPPGSQLMVQAGARQVPARVTMADDALGLCKLLTDGYVGEPLGVAAAPPAAGATVYAASIGAKGDVGLKETTVTKVVDEGGGKAMQASAAAQPGAQGAPLLDAQGRVVAVATLQPDGTFLHRTLPPTWLAENRPRAEEPRPYQGGGSPGAASGSGGSASGGTSPGGSSVASASGSGAGRYAPPLENTDYGCDCDIAGDAEFMARREERWKKISELPPGERESAAKRERQAEEATRRIMKQGNEALRKRMESQGGG